MGMDSSAQHPAECDCPETTIVVEPVPRGWRLRCECCGEPLMLLSGADADSQAQGLARRLADAGQKVRIQAHRHEGAATELHERGHA